MKTSLLKFTWILSLAFLGLLSFNTAFAQAKFKAQGLNMSIKGTSTLHDWEMKSNEGQCEALIALNHDRVTFSGLSFTLPAKSLKSGHGMMDKNTYKALDTDKNPNISFVLSSANITPIDENTYSFKGTGKLTIAGTTKQTDLVATVKYNAADKSFTCIGTKKFKMTEYNVKPPTVMMGTIKTGDEISISYNLKMKS